MRNCIFLILLLTLQNFPGLESMTLSTPAIQILHRIYAQYLVLTDKPRKHKLY